MQNVFEHCEHLVRDADKDRFLTTLFAPAGRRNALYALYAFDIEIARVRSLAREPMPGEIRLQWWREVLQGERAGEAQASPVADALMQALADTGLARAPLLEVIEARTFDLYDEPISSLAELETYTRRTAGNVITSAAAVLDPSFAAVAPAADHAAIAVGVSDVLRNLGWQLARRQLFIPIEILERYAVPLGEAYGAHSSPRLLAALGEMRRHAWDHLRKAGALLSGITPNIIPAFLPAALVPLHLRAMERRDYDPFRTPLEVPQWRRQWTLWRAARTGRIG